MVKGLVRYKGLVWLRVHGQSSFVHIQTVACMCQRIMNNILHIPQQRCPKVQRPHHCILV